MKLNWKKLGSAATLVGALLLLSIVGFSQQGPPQGPPPGDFHRGPGGPHDGLGPLGRGVNLTDAQKAQIKTLIENFETSTKALHDQIKALHESAPDPWSDSFDAAAASKVAQQVAPLQANLEVAHLTLMSQIYALLTPEQKAQVAANKQAMAQRHPPGPPPAGAPNE